VQRVESCMVVHNAVGLTSIKGGFSALLLAAYRLTSGNSGPPTKELYSDLRRIRFTESEYGFRLHSVKPPIQSANPNLDSRIHFRRGFTN